MIVEYDRMKGVTANHYVMYRVDCFGEMDGPYYSDSILYYADTRQELEELCNEKGWELKPIHVWNEYYIGVSK